MLLSGGSGVTPHLGMIRAALRHLPQTAITFVYGSRSPAQALFLDELRALATSHPAQLTLRLFVDDPEGATWDGGVGPLTEAQITEALAGHDSLRDPAAWFGVCGPEAMSEGAVRALRQLGAPEASVHVERFTAGARPVSADAPQAFERPSRSPFAEAIKIERLHRPLPGKTFLSPRSSRG
ncbi:MAG: hypothetical protein IPI35_31605 [Deltaproteobacteria bacterium]|nr:hypothetical protein [Deltaproteobacteria bacterium]